MSEASDFVERLCRLENNAMGQEEAERAAILSELRAIREELQMMRQPAPKEVDARALEIGKTVISRMARNKGRVVGRIIEKLAIDFQRNQTLPEFAAALGEVVQELYGEMEAPANDENSKVNA